VGEKKKSRLTHASELKYLSIELKSIGTRRTVWVSGS
jgi:hypothetical protein